ncbi:MAG: hypothetical protein HYZ42_05990 [Bacteroidetes bacterium]|nr:hypothetical protein [Bacteroidota bacterium]
MSEVIFQHPDIVRPCGSLVDIVAHPNLQKNQAIEIATFNEHRFAFYFWNKWLRNKQKKEPAAMPPALVSLDWHQDLVYPNNLENELLQQLDLSSKGDVSLFCWAKLNPLNDGHIMAAAYLNLIGNVYINCRQGRFADDWKDETIVDINGNTHLIKKFKEYSALESTLLKSKEDAVFFDIDLDYFTVKNGLNDGKFKFTYLSDKEIVTSLSPDRPLINWIFERMEGFTIALEPQHTGGLLKSNRYLGLLDKIYFKPGLFAHRSNWKHVTNFRSKRDKI